MKMFMSWLFLLSGAVFFWKFWNFHSLKIRGEIRAFWWKFFFRETKFHRKFDRIIKSKYLKNIWPYHIILWWDKRDRDEKSRDCPVPSLAHPWLNYNQSRTKHRVSFWSRMGPGVRQSIYYCTCEKNLKNPVKVRSWEGVFTKARHF